MAVDKRFIVSKLQNAEELYVLFSRTTRLPFMKRDTETKKNQICIFGAEEAAKAAGEKLQEEQYAIQVVKVEQKDLLTFFTELFLMNVNSVSYEEDGEVTVMDLGEIVKPQIPEENGRRPLFNPALKSAVMFFLQELRKPGSAEKPSTELKLRGEQINAMLASSRFITGVIVPEGEEKINSQNLQLPLVKAQNGDNYQPLFSDFQEFQKYNKQNRLRPMVMSLAEVQTLLVNDSKGFLLNPNSMALPLTKEMIPNILKTYMSWAVPKDSKNLPLRTAVRKLQNSKEVYVIYSAVTHMPFVKCDEEVFDDEIFVYSTEEACKEAAKAFIEEKYAVMAAKVEGRQLLRFFSDLYFIGINGIVFTEGENVTRMQLDDLVNEIDYQNLSEKNRPVMNANLHLTALYFLQEVRKPRTEEERKEMGAELHDQDEELSANLFKGKYIVPATVEQNAETQKNEVKVPFIKDKNEDMYLPVFTDIREYMKFDKERKFRQIVLDFNGIRRFQSEQAKGYILNPTGFALPLQWRQLAIIAQKFEPDDETEKN